MPLTRRALIGAGLMAVPIGTARAAEPIKVGAAISQTGALSDSAEHIRKAIVLWQEETNKADGLLGRQIEVVMYDDRSDTATAAKLTERLATLDKVDVIVAPFGSGATAAASVVSERHKRVMINVAGAAEQIHQRGFKYIFQIVPPIGDYVTGVFPIAKAFDLKSVAFVSRDYVASRNAEASLRANAKASGIDLLLVEYFPAGTADFSSILTRMRGLNPDIWISIAYTNEVIEMVKQMRSVNYMPKMFVSNGTSQDDFIKASGEDGEFIFGISNYEPHQQSKDNAAFVKAYKARWQDEPGYYAAMGWGGLQVFGEAVVKTGSTDQNAVRDALSQLKTETPFGPYEVDATGLQTAKKSMIVQVRGKRREIVWPFDLQSAKPVIPIPPWSAR